jgi:uncharacterized repeat protein (TIGR01451 family)
MKRNRLLKIYIFLGAFLIIAGAYLAITLVSKTNNVKAADTYAGKTNRNGQDANCRTRGISCSDRAEFLGFNEGSLGGDNRMLYCRTLNTMDADGWRYGRWEADDVAKCYPNICAQNPGYHSDGVNADCRNPYKCPPAPAPETKQIRVEAYCDGNIQLGITYEVARDGYYHSDSTNSSAPNTRVDQNYNVINRDDNGSLNDERSKYPNIHYVGYSGTSSGNGKTATVSGNGSTVRFNYEGCGPTSTPRNTPTNSPTPTPSTPTPTPIARKCLGLTFADGSKVKTVNLNDTLDIVARTENPSAVWGKVVPFNLDNNGVPAKLPIVASPAGYSRMEVDAPDGNPNAVRFQLTGGVNSGNIGTYTFKVKASQLFQVDQNTGQVMKNAKFHSYAGHYPLANDENCEVVLHLAAITITPTLTPTPTRPTQEVTPKVSIVKTLTSNAQPVQGQVTFNIDVKNIGDVDLRNFVVADDYDPAYLQFISASHNGQNLPPVQGTGQNGRLTLTWNDLPSGNGILKVGETYQIKLTFKSLKDSRPTETLENDNCGIVSQITFTDSNGQTIIRTITDQRSCAEFTTTTELTVLVSKETLTPSVSVGQEVKFKAVITNNTTDKTYSKVDFIDLYNTTYLKPVRVKVTGPNGAVKTYCPLLIGGCDATFNTVNPIRINDVQSVSGALAPGKAYQFEIVFMAQAPVKSTCDTVKTDVVDNGGNPTSGTSPERCAEITAPPPPKTGANFIVSFIIPAAVFMMAGAGRFALKYKMVG